MGAVDKENEIKKELLTIEVFDYYDNNPQLLIINYAYLYKYMIFSSIFA